MAADVAAHIMDWEIKQQKRYRLVIQAVASSLYTEGERLEVETTACLRHLPGRRSVWQASCQERQILLKIYECHTKQDRDADREWNHASRIFQMGLPIAPPLFRAIADDGLVTVAYEFISNGVTLSEHLADTDESGQRDGLRQLLKIHALQHEAGCYQADDHLGNYLWNEGALLMMDAETCVVKAGSLSLDHRVSNMALLTANISLSDRQIYDEEFSVYLDHCSGEVDRSRFDIAYRKAVPRAIRTRLRDYRRKTRRSSSAFERVRLPGKRWHACRTMDQGLKSRLLDDADQFFSNHPLLMDGNNCTGVCLAMGGREYVLKRYNRNALLYRILHVWMPPPALRSWTGGHALRLFGIPTPCPVACLLVKSGPMIDRAYLLMEKVSGRSLSSLDESQVKASSGKFAQRWCELERLKVSHGDLKASNLILTDDGTLAFIDLDDIEFHRWSWSHARKQRKEWARVMRNWKSQPDVQTAIRDAVEGLRCQK